jgi:uncharacterized protein (TIGR03000 family)
MGFGYGNPYYGGYGWGNGWNNAGYGWGNSPWYYGNRNYYGWNNAYRYPAYSGNYGGGSYPSTESYSPGTEWSGTEYTGNAPSYYGEDMNQGMQGQYAGAAGQGYAGQAYGTMASGQMDNRVLITMRVPPNAQVWFDNDKTAQTGVVRSYISPPLNPNGDFAYHVRVQWTENGRPVDRTRKVDVHAGDRLFVNFMQPSSQGTGGAPAGQYGNTDQYRGTPGAAPMPNNNTGPNNNAHPQSAPNLGPNNTQGTDQNTNPQSTRPTNRAGAPLPSDAPRSPTTPNENR